MEANISELLRYAIDFARQAGDHTLTYFRKGTQVEFKSDDSPVTRADREAEEILRGLIMQHFPEHGILGEEFGTHQPEARVQWILDPIDGTLSFIHGIPLYTTLIGILIDGQPEIGVVYAPATGELAEAGTGLGARLNGETIRVRDTSDISRATLLTTDIRNVHRYGMGEAHDKLLRDCYVHRTWGDAYGHMMVAAGRADIMLDPILSLWDAAPLTSLLREAGGTFMDRTGNENLHAGHGISVSLRMKEKVLSYF